MSETYEVVVNDEEQYSIWRSDRPIPDGWKAVGKSGPEEECLAYIDETWTDMRPRSLREALDGRPIGNGHTTIAMYELEEHAADPFTWVEAYAGRIRGTLATGGAVLLRGLDVDVEGFDRIVHLVGGEPLQYTERSTPRTNVSGGIYTSTEYPPDQQIPMHNESSYADTWPGYLFFHCDTAPETGGATPIADSRAMLRLIPDDVRKRFEAGVLYTRTFRKELGLTWQESFQTEDPAAVEVYLEDHGQTYEWDGDTLRTRALRPATMVEPRTGDEVWFNQANLFHASALDEEIREMLLSLYGESDLPRHAYLADGSPIEDSDLAAIRRAYDEASFAFPWQRGDVLIITNMLCAHGRQAFTGARRILVAMTAVPGEVP